MAGLRFGNGERWYPANRSVLFDASLANADGWITCAISSDALRDRFGATSGEQGDLIAAFRRNRQAIEKTAEELIKAGRYEADGSILIRREDAIWRANAV
jgi:hypothetical protein